MDCITPEEQERYVVRGVRLRREAWDSGDLIEWYRLLLHPHRNIVLFLGLILTITFYQAPSGIFLMSLAAWTQDRGNRIAFWLAWVFLPIALGWAAMMTIDFLNR